jgi:predicted membrane protein
MFAPKVQPRIVGILFLISGLDFELQIKFKLQIKKLLMFHRLYINILKITFLINVLTDVIVSPCHATSVAFTCPVAKMNRSLLGGGGAAATKATQLTTYATGIETSLLYRLCRACSYIVTHVTFSFFSFLAYFPCFENNDRGL